MSVEVRSEWTCDWCRTRREGYGGDDKLPDSWQKVELPGVDYSPTRHLCRPCFWKYEKALPVFKDLVQDFWLKQLWAVPQADDAKPETELD